ncbi:hypothetical protein PHYSODRAFT_342208 [Phytophthora sojae]|uniref:Uncharacterized protein n=1 Tax=Phytophthora sojae (strain P6497) TaxID=1094619 RepID=G5AFP0_PHYSP|nr:hypothetical protein PHYSODRAFT_342208 [Phytophthora sojae]EGZ06030.1 hypothetical protein PHYSODRAFT_342208 [Phytophthora sojae]|eukprot:XP_009538891.1 hypothetical protein PHYSODRAFT_342208 [Phytophthora sojae]
MMADTGTVKLDRSIESREPPLFQRSGETIEDFVAVIERWAANPAEMDYWIPASSVCPTIDAVAKCDSNAAISIVKNPGNHKANKHIEIRPLVVALVYMYVALVVALVVVAVYDEEEDDDIYLPLLEVPLSAFRQLHR